MDEIGAWVLANFARRQALLGYAFMAGLACFASTVGYLLGEGRKAFRWGAYLVSLAASVLSSLVMLWLATARALDPFVAASIVTMVAFAGPRGARMLLGLSERVK